MDLSIDFIVQIRDAVSRHAIRTPLIRSDHLSVATGRDVFLKCENLQRTGSFKLRGALAELSVSGKKEGVVTASAGNHGRGLALAARLAGVPCTVVVPKEAPEVKVAGIRADGAEVIRSPHAGYDDTQAWTLANLERFGKRFVSAFDAPAVMAGNGGTTFLEILEDGPAFDSVVVPCGGGGFIAGAGVAARATSPATKIVGVNTDASPGMWRSFKDGVAYQRIESQPTICEGLEGGVGEEAYRIAREVVHEIALVPEASVRRAVKEIARYEHMIVEGSAAAGVAALLEGQVEGKVVCVVLTGSNIDWERFLELARDPTA